MLEIFQFSMTLLVSLTGLTAAIAEGFPISALTVPIALTTWYFVDRKRLFRIPNWAAPCLGLLAFAATATEYSLATERSYLMVGNHLLAYLTWIFLLQPKERRSYWTLFALSVIQIAVTSLLTFSVWFGLALLAYALLATWTLSIFLLYRCVKSLREDDTGRNSQPHKMVAGRFRSGVSRDRSERLVTPRFCGSTVSVTALALCVATLFFLLIPRIWSNPRDAMGGKPATPLTGFTNEVRLGDMGEILESGDKVMEIRIFDAATDQPLTPQESEKYLGTEPRFRGGVLEEYHHGRWQRPQQRTSRQVDAFIDIAKYRLQIELDALNSETIFSFGNTVGARPAKSYGTITWDYFSDELNRGEETDLERSFTYDLFTIDGRPDDWLSQQRQLELMAENRFNFRYGIISPMTRRNFRDNLEHLSQVPVELDPLYQITDDVVGNLQGTPYETARRIEEWLMVGGDFTYSLDVGVTDTEIDPILDFLQNRRSGHCEYFASAMAMMLRCVQIPSRVITGFKGGVFSPISNSLTVQQFHAHAWVEAYIDGRWVTFDPTPEDRNEAVQEIEGEPTRLSHWWRTGESIWHRLSVLSRDGQNERIYQPLVTWYHMGKEAVGELMQGRTDGIKRLLAFVTSPERWFSYEGAVVGILIALLASACLWLLGRLYQASRTLKNYLKSHSSPHGPKVPKVPFYERLVALLKAHGLMPQPTQTAREFIHSALPQLEPRLASHGLMAWPEAVVENFYRVRYGQETLNPSELTMLEERLADLEACLNSPPEKTRDPKSSQ